MTDYTTLQVEAALCVWEDLLERTSTHGSPDRELIEFRGAHGAVALRHEAIRIGCFAEQVYNLLPKDALDAYAYDWEFIPAVVSLVAWRSDGQGNISTLPDPAETAKTVLIAITLSSWIREANHLSKTRYSVSLTDDCGIERDELRKAVEAGTTPADYVEHHAEKYALDRTDQAWG